MLNIILLCTIIFCTNGYTQIEKLSTDESISILKMIDNFEQSDNDTIKEALHLKIKNLTGQNYSVNLKQDLYENIGQNFNHTSISSKLIALILFKNVIIVIMVCVGVAFCISLAIFMYGLFAPFIDFLVIKILLNKHFMYGMGLLTSTTLMIVKPEQITNYYVKLLYIFDWLTPLFGCIIFGIVTFIIFMDVTRDKHNKEYNLPLIGAFIIIVWFLDAIYLENWLIGVATIIMLFFTNGFLFGTMPEGFYGGFESKTSVTRCLITSVSLNAIMLFVKTGFITGNFVKYAQIFESGIFVWATLVGSLSMLILTKLFEFNNFASKTSVEFVMMNIVTTLYYLGIIFFGTILNISGYKSIGGTFLVLFGLDMERCILRKFSNGNTTIALFIVLVNLYMVKELIGMFPEYCIF